MSVAIFIDADACPVKDEIYRVAERHRARDLDVSVAVVSNQPIAVPRADFIERVVVPAGPDAALTPKPHWGTVPPCAVALSR
jgi:uncharacterized protein YaiI (UPF0178 family)